MKYVILCLIVALSLGIAQQSTPVIPPEDRADWWQAVAEENAAQLHIQAARAKLIADCGPDHAPGDAPKGPVCVAKAKP